jgi:hypothetical protein
VARQEPVDGGNGIVVVREGDRHDTQCVVGQLAVGAWQLLGRDQLMSLARENGAIEHAGERRQAVVVQALLEQ